MSNLTAPRINVGASTDISPSSSRRLSILQYNVYKSKDIVMASCLRDTEVKKYDILTIQEPWLNAYMATSHHPIKEIFRLIYPVLELRTNHSISLRASSTYHVSFPFHSGDRAPHFQYSCVASNVLRVLTSSAPSIKRHIYSFMYLSHLAPTFMFCDQSCSEHRAPRATLL